ncbi:MAG: L,D-transpeptidase [Limosilactobacillus sp.]|uniref:L,D-transpeptidase n=1 Tax=Limosilactobacillus sp. TaxID=2773925 RepID=UPI0027015FB9|nr:L,D-transpeptidase [Limosilactobacillus sp.]
MAMTSKPATVTAADKPSHMRTPIDYRKPSETVAYPDLQAAKNLWIKVSIKKCRAYIYDGNKLIYTMYCSAGVYEKDAKTGKMVSKTPTGTFHIQSQRGAKFFNSEVQVGANDYVSWNGNGEYLFHSVPTDKNGNYMKKEAAKLGKTQASHGCIRLSIPDAKWFHDTVPTGTKVVVVDK